MMTTPVSHPVDIADLRRVLPVNPTDDEQRRVLLTQEWLLTNGLGGYAAGTVPGVITRRYHGVLVAALPAPLGRFVMLNQIGERVRLRDGRVVWLSGEERANGTLYMDGARHIAEFRLEGGLPVWVYAVENVRLEKRLLLPYGQNTALVQYRVLDGGDPVRLTLRPLTSPRPHEAPVDRVLPEPPPLRILHGGIEIEFAGELPPLRLRLADHPAAFTVDPLVAREIRYRVEESRGYDASGDLWSAGYFRFDLAAGETATLIASTEPWDVIDAVPPAEAWALETQRRQRLLVDAGAGVVDRTAAELVLAADQFVILPSSRTAELTRTRAAGAEPRTVIAGYHWFTDWGRDTMIALEGLTLATGRAVEARGILLTFSHYFRDGLIPNMFPEGDQEGLYHTADATLWYFHALDRYLEYTGDWPTVHSLLPVLWDSVGHHVEGTRFHIAVDPADGLLSQGEAGYQLTWMDAKVDDWVVTPRRGKAVEINALWYNALRLLGEWLTHAGEAERARTLDLRADQVFDSFNRRFWYEDGGFLYDIVDGEEGDDAACRPNQVFALSLRHAVLAPERWPAVLDVVTDRLLTPLGLRSLDPAHPDFKARYDGDLRARDAAYHQGTVWGWLIGPFVDAWMRVHPERPHEARHFLEGFLAHLDHAGVGSISEVFDAQAPFTARGCVAQAWSVAEVLRCWMATTPESE
jgi:predicted glycogen debranching enzyme